MKQLSEERTGLSVWWPASTILVRSSAIGTIDRAAWMAAFDSPEFWNPKVRGAQWVQSGVMRGILEALAAELKIHGLIDVEEAFIDGSFAPSKLWWPLEDSNLQPKDYETCWWIAKQATSTRI